MNFAKARVVLRLVTLAVRFPALNSTAIKMLAVPFLIDVVVITFLMVAGNHGDTLSLVCEKLFWLLVETNHWISRFIWLFVQVENVIHSISELLVYFRDTPHSLQPRSSFAFLDQTNGFPVDGFETLSLVQFPGQEPYGPSYSAL